MILYISCRTICVIIVVDISNLKRNGKSNDIWKFGCPLRKLNCLITQIETYITISFYYSNAYYSFVFSLFQSLPFFDLWTYASLSSG